MPFEKGQSGNPNGRPRKGTTLTDIMKELLEVKDVNSGYDTMSRKKAVLQKVISLAIKGEQWATKLIFEYIEGRPIQRVEQENKDISSVQAVFTSELKHFIEDEDDSE